MGQIIIFEETWDCAMQGLENLVLFGEKDWIKDPDNVYDLIFYSKQIINPYDKEKPGSLVIPVLKNLNDEEAIAKITQLNIEHPAFERYAVSGEFLDFYEVIEKEGGRELKYLGKYNLVPEKKFIKHFGSIKLRRAINEKRRVIDNKYK